MSRERPSSFARWFAWGGWIASAALLALGAAWWLRGTATWSDGRSIRLAASDLKPRNVVWTPPRPLDLPWGEAGGGDAGQVYEPSLSPDGNALYFVRGKPGTGAKIYASHHRDGAWSEPEPIDAVNGDGFDALGPRVTADGEHLLFYSNRPGGLGGYDIWAAPRIDGGWGEPFNLGPSVNSEFNEYNPDPTPDGQRLIFATNRKAASIEQRQAWQGTIRQSATADYDLWIAVRLAATTQPATQPTDGLAFADAHEIANVNTSYTEGASRMSPAGDFLYFASNRPGGYGRFDLYRSRALADGSFAAPKNLGPSVNSAANETDPALAFDGFRLAFSSDRADPAGGRYDLYTSESREVFAERLARPLPRIGPGVWSLATSALLMLPLALLLRKTRSRPLTVLQRCLFLSLLIHAVAAFLFSFVAVSRDVVRMARAGSGGAGEVELNLHVPGDVAIASAIRGQFSMDGVDATASAAEAMPRASRVEAEAADAKALSVDAVANPASDAARPLPGSAIALAPMATPLTLPDASPSEIPLLEIGRGTAGDIDLVMPATGKVHGSGPSPQAAAVDARVGPTKIESSTDVGRLSIPAVAPAAATRPADAAGSLAIAAPPTLAIVAPRGGSDEAANPALHPQVIAAGDAMTTPAPKSLANVSAARAEPMTEPREWRHPAAPLAREESHGDGSAATSQPILAAALTPGTPTIPATSVAIPAVSRISAPAPDAGPAELSPVALGTSLGPAEATAPQAVFPRAEPTRRQRVRDLGGTDESEQAVDRALAYVAANQEPDGRWTYVTRGGPAAGQRLRAPHDAACTGLAVLTFLARDHAPSKDGPYRLAVTRGLDYLVAIQGDDGDLRGLPAFRGSGPSRADMYDHAIATLALAEGATMSAEPRYTAAAVKGAQFIVAAQDPRGGGWRYEPGEYGDSSVFGWQVMALHAAERLGFAIPDATRDAALRYVRLCGSGRSGLLGAYQPNHAPSAAMTAELLYARALLGDATTDDDRAEPIAFILRQAPDLRNPDLYCWYYGSLCLLQSQGEAWKLWNAFTRDALVLLQRRDAGDGEDASLAGSWDETLRWGDRGGRIFTTALATLTLEVYYRYLPEKPASR